jgi:hypothetical protein
VNPAAPPKDPNAEYEAALKKYEDDVDEYRVRKQDHEEKVKKGKELVQKLNNRFADWYYVISAEVYDDLNVTPEELIEPKDAKPAAGTPAIPGAPGAALPAIPGLDSLTPPAETPKESTTPPADTTETPAAPPAGEKPDASAPPATATPPEAPATEAPKTPGT